MAYLRRRSLLAGAVAAAGLPRAVGAAEQAGLLVAGPDGGQLSAWAAALTPALLRGLPAGSTLIGQRVGGADGVTGANQFEARVSPDGTNLMLLPGAAALAWLAGDPRVHFDAAGWLPVLCGVSAGVLACRRPIDGPNRTSALRVAVDGALGSGAAALLALDLIGAAAMPVGGLADPAAALQAGDVDAAFLPGPTAAMLTAAKALYALGAPDLQIDNPLLPGVPTLAAMIEGGDPALETAWRAAAAAAQLDYALVMAPLSDPASVALWRRAATGALADAELQPAFPPGVRSLAVPACNSVLATIAADSEALLAYRRWLAERLRWQPG